MQSSKKHKSVNSLDIYERNYLSPLEEKDLSLKKTEENMNQNNSINVNVNNFANTNSNNNKNKKKGGIPKLNFMK